MRREKVDTTVKVGQQGCFVVHKHTANRLTYACKASNISSLASFISCLQDAKSHAESLNVIDLETGFR